MTLFLAAVGLLSQAFADDPPETFRQLKRAFDQQNYNIVAQYGPLVIRKGLPADEMLDTRRMVDTARFQLAMVEGTEESLSRYISQEPNGSRLRDARQRVCDMQETSFGRIGVGNAPRVDEWLLVCANTTRWSSVKVALAQVQRADEEIAGAQVVEESVTGVGTTLDEALRNGWQSAVSNVVGALVDVETVVQNGALLHDTVLTQSAGFVQTYKQGTVRQRDGLLEVAMTVTVRKTRLGLALKRSGITTRKVDGSIYATAVTKAKLAADTRRMLVRKLDPAFEGALLRTVVSALSEPTVTPAGTYVIQQPVRIVVDPDIYASMTSDLRSAVEAIAISREEIFCDISGAMLNCSAPANTTRDVVAFDIYRQTPEASDRLRGTRFLVPALNVDTESLQRLRFDGGTVFRVALQALGSDSEDVLAEAPLHVGERTADVVSKVTRENTVRVAPCVAIHPARGATSMAPQQVIVMDRFISALRTSADLGTYTMESRPALTWMPSFALSEVELSRVRSMRAQLSVLPR